MALPSSGTISMNDIRVELGISTQAPFNIDTARKGGYVALNPYSPTTPPYNGTVSLASWYSYCQNCTTLYTHTIYLYFNSHGALEGWASSVDACNGGSTNSITLYSSDATLGVGSTLYELYGSVYYPFNLVSFGPGYWIYDYNQGLPWDMGNSTSNTITNSGTCYATWLISYGKADPNVYGCDSTGPFSTTVYSNNSSFIASTQFFTDSSLTSAFNGNSDWYVNSTFQSGTMIQIDSGGYNIDFFAC